MKLGLSSPLEHRTPEEWAENMKKIGCQAVNFPVDYEAPDSLIEAYAQAAKAQRLIIAEVGAWCNPIAPDREVRKKALERCRGQLRLADALGACCCVNVSGSKGERWDGPYRENFTEETWRDMVKSIQEIIDDVKPQNTFYTIEPMPWMYPMGPEEYRRLLKDVLLKQEFILQLEETACGQGGLNLKKYRELIDRTDPDIPVIIEHLDSDREYLESLGYIRNIFKI